MSFVGNYRRGAAVCAAMLLIMVVLLVPACFADDASEAGEAIDQAERDLNAAYVKVAEADNAGADVSVLLNKLNSAGTYIAKANAAFNAGDYDSASVLATDCINGVKGVASEAANLASHVQGARNSLVLTAVFVSVVGVFLVIVFGFMGWRRLRRRYFRELLDKQPKVA